jgi:hypothetical protein
MEAGTRRIFCLSSVRTPCGPRGRLAGTTQRAYDGLTPSERLRVAERQNSRRGPHIVQCADVWMIQLRHRRRFAGEAFGKFGFGNPESDSTVEPRVAGFVHLTLAFRRGDPEPRSFVRDGRRTRRAHLR